MAVLNSGGGRGKLGRNTDNSSQFMQGDDSVSVLVKAAMMKKVQGGAGRGQYYSVPAY